MKKIVLIAAVLLSVCSLGAQSKLSNRTRLFLSDAAQDTMYQSSATRSLMRSATNAGEDAMVQVFVHFYDGVDRSLLEEYGLVVESEFPKTQLAICRASAEALEALGEDDAIRYIEVATPVGQKMDKARVLSRADDVISGTAPLQSPYLGKDVVVGIVDCGFQYAHAAFYDKDQTALRVKRVWNQNLLSGGAPDGYNRGTEYVSEDDILYAGYDDRSDEVGHGTHVAGIAAGADHTDGNPYYGIAQESDMVFVSYYRQDQTNAEVANGVKYVFEYAEKVGKPAVVNLSLGSHIGPHDGTSTFDRIVDDLVGPGRIVVGAAGNEGNDEYHLYKEFDSVANDTMVHTFVDFLDDRNMGGLGIWGDTTYKFRVVIYNELRSSCGGPGYKYTSDFYDIADYLGKTINLSPKFEFTGEDNKGETYSVSMAATVSVSVEKNPFNQKYNTEMNFSMFNTPEKPLYLGFEVVADTGSVHIWADDMYMALNDYAVDCWDEPDSYYGVGEIGGTAKKMITVGAYVSNNTVPGYTKSGEIGDKTKFSSMGPTADGRVKPEILAPGCAVASSVPDTRAVLNGASYQNANTTTVNDKKYYYSYMQGTSMAAPYVTGTIATWLQANKELTYDSIVDIFEKTAIRDQYYGDEMPNNRFGYGRINAFGGLLEVFGLYTSVDNVEMPSSIMAYPNPTSGEFNLGFTRNDSNVNIAVYSMNGQIVYNREVGSTAAGENIVVSLDNVANGAYVVKVSGDAANETFRLIVAK